MPNLLSDLMNHSSQWGTNQGANQSNQQSAQSNNAGQQGQAGQSANQSPSQTTGQNTNQSNPSNQAPWFGSVDEESGQYLKTKGWDGVGSMLKSYRELENRMGNQEQFVKLDPKDPESLKTVYKKLGVPESPSAYGLETRPNADPEFAKAMSHVMHSANLTPEQANKLADAVDKMNAETIDKYNLELQTRQNEAINQLKKDWGTNFDQKMQSAINAAKALGVDENMLNTMDQHMGSSKMLSLFVNIGEKISGDSLRDAGSSNISLTPDTAKKQIESLRANPEFMTKYSNGDVLAKDKMQSLYRIAYGE